MDLKFLTFTLFAILINSVYGTIVELKTPQGVVLGTRHVTEDDGVEFWAFRGIQYGKVAHRFQSAEPVKFLNDGGEYDATSDTPTCMQGWPNKREMSEDCLHLNVYVPKNNIDSTPIPVMFWIYGGGFNTGDNQYDMFTPDYLLENGVIVVVINYRLSGYGFLSNEDDIKGNAGFKDAILALEWTRDNIAKFGGDPGSVTIFGQSAGAAMSSYLATSPLTRDKGLFHRAIFASGSALCPWAIQRFHKDHFKTYAKAAGCNDVECLYEAPLDVVMKADAAAHIDYVHFLSGAMNGMTFAPVYEPGVIENTYEMMSNGSLNFHVPYIIGITSLEGIGYEKHFPILDDFFSQVSVHPELLTPQSMYADTQQSPQIGQMISDRYFEGNAAEATNAQIAKYISALLYDKVMRKYLDLTRNLTPSYCYVFNHVPEYSKYHETISNVVGTGHVEDMPFYFKEFFGMQLGEEDLPLKRTFVKLWTNFAKTGDPNKPLAEDDFTWPLATNQEDSVTRCLDVQLKLGVVENPKQKEYDYWNELYRTYGHPKDAF